MISAKFTSTLVLVLLLLGASFLFREDISRLLSFQEKAPAGSMPYSDESSLLGGEEGNKKESAQVLPTPVKPVISAPARPQYTGRDPTEVRPVPDEVRLFTAEQKEQLYATLQTHGRAVKADPEYFNGWIQVGILKKTIGDFEGAGDAWEYAGVIQPLNSLSFANLGELYWRYLHDYPKSEKNFRISIKNKPYDPATYISLAELYHYSMKEKYDLADDVLLEGIAANPQDNPYESLARRLAYLYEQRKEDAKALDWWKKVLSVAPGDEEVKKDIAELEAKLPK